MNSGGQINNYLVSPGATLNVGCAGDRFYVVGCPGVIGINWGQGESLYYQGTGANCGEEFTQLQIRNPGKNQTVVQIWSGFSDFIDRRFIPLGSEVGVVVPTLIQVFSSPFGQHRDLPDLSQSVVTNAGDGLNYFAVSRTSISLFNLSSDSAGNGVPVLLSVGPVFGSSPGLTEIPSAENGATNPLLPLAATVISGIAGTFHVTPGDSSVQAWLMFIYEIYQGIPVPGQ